MNTQSIYFFKKCTEYLKMRLIHSICSASVFFAVGDCAAQHIEKRLNVESYGKNRYNFERSLRMALTGAFYAGPGQHMLIQYLNRTGLRIFKHDQKTQSAVFKSSLDQFVFQPFNLIGYMIFTGILEKKNVQQIEQKICKRDLVSLWKESIIFWIPVSLLNFRFVPPAFQPFVVFLAHPCWQTRMSFVNHRADYPKL